MGHTFGPDLFMKEYNQQLSEWIVSLTSTDQEYTLSHCRDPVTHTMNDLPLTVFVGDVAEQHLSLDNKKITKRVQKCNDKTEQKLTSGGYKLNKSKEQLLVGLRGKGAHGTIRSLVRNTIIGETTKTARYLGVMMGKNGEIWIEVIKRVAAMKRSPTSSSGL